MRAIVLTLVLAAVWLLWSGIFEPLILAFGVGSCLFTAILCWRFSTIDAEGAPFHVIGRVLLYLPWLLLEIVKANLDVTQRILSPTMKISPVLFDAPSTQKSELGRTIFANSITLTPGTVSYGIEDGIAKVHAIDREVRDGLLNGPMDRKSTWVEGLK